MAWKPRLIHPSCCTSISLANVSLAAEVLWWHIISQCDDQGRIVGDTKTLKGITVPVRQEITLENIPELLTELETESLIIRYSNSATPLIQVKTWWSHETPQWAYPSHYPPPTGWHDKLRYRHQGKVLTKNWSRTPAKEPDEPLGKAKGKSIGKEIP